MAREMKSSPSGEKKLEQYGVWVKIEPQDVPASAQGEGAFELSDLEPGAAESGSTAVATAEEALTPEEEELLDELETELSPDEGASQPLPQAEEISLEPLGEVMEEVSAFDTQESSGAAPALADEDVLELPGEAFSTEMPEAADFTAEEAGASVEVPLSDEIPQEEHFDDLKALEDELATVTASTSGAASQTSRAQSAEILARIEEELRTIRGDLTDLRRELSVLRTREPKAAAGKPAESDTQGFFDEDEDDTIALTGDELDNILNTAEITEEPAEGAVVEPETDGDMSLGLSEDGGQVSEDVDILSYDAQPPAPQPAAAEELSDSLPDLELDTIGLGEGTPEEASLPDLEAEPLPAGESETLDLDSLDANLVTEVPADLELETLEGTEEPESLDLETVEDVEEAPALELETAEESAPAALDDLAVELEGLPEIVLDEGTSTPGEPVSDLEIESLGEPISPQEETLEAIPEIEELEAEDGTAATEAEELPEELDLESLAGDTQGLSPAEAAALGMDDLEALPEVEEAPAAGESEIEIDFEQQAAAPAEAEAEAEEVLEAEEVPADEAPAHAAAPGASPIPEDLKDDIRSVLKYMDQLLEALPEEKIQEFANSEYFVMYKKLFEDLGLGE
jgi:pilus assembly protein FimV